MSGASEGIAARLAALGIELPAAAAPVANYVASVAAGGLLVVSGQLPLAGGRLHATGIVGVDVTVADATEAARLAFVNVLAQALAATGDLERIARVVRLGGFVASTPAFTRHAEVMNGASDLAVAVFGERGRHARSTIGVSSLPLGAPVEIEATFLLD